MEAPLRKIIHIDMDCFYAAVEVRDNPDWLGLPLAVGGTSPRSVIATANYPARTFGVRSAMPTHRALEHCPHLNIVPPNFEKYKAISRQIHGIYERFTSVIEPLSLDEAFLDVSHSQETATRIAHQIRKLIREELDLNASAGIAPNKMLAKIASDWKKPNGQFTIHPGEIESFMRQLPLSKLWGLGPKSVAWLKRKGCITCGDLQALSLETLIRHFGKSGPVLYHLCRGRDDRPVETRRLRKSISCEETFDQNLQDLSAITMQLARIHTAFFQDPDTRSYLPRGVKAFAKLKFDDFTRTTAETTTSNFELPVFQKLVTEAFSRQQMPVRLLGIGIRLSSAENEQILFDLPSG